MTRLPNLGSYPAGDLRYVYLHWTGGDGYDGTVPFVARTHDLRHNMRDVRRPGTVVRAGYLGAGNGEPWDIARFGPGPKRLETSDAERVGAELRGRIAAL